jgi:hypothetical protein
MFVVTYLLTHQGRAVTCTTCRKTSYNSEDIANGYCNRCHQFHIFIARAIAMHAALAGRIES